MLHMKMRLLKAERRTAQAGSSCRRFGLARDLHLLQGAVSLPRAVSGGQCRTLGCALRADLRHNPIQVVLRHTHSAHG